MFHKGLAVQQAESALVILPDMFQGSIHNSTVGPLSPFLYSSLTRRSFCVAGFKHFTDSGVITRDGQATTSLDAIMGLVRVLPLTISIEPANLPPISISDSKAMATS